VSLREVSASGGRHFCDLPRFMDTFDHDSGEVHQCDNCGRFWRLWMGSRHFDWERVGWWESRRLRRLLRKDGEQR
jgi:hypothetical protein